MSEHTNIKFFDYFLLLIKWKKTFIIGFVVSFVITYLLIYFFIEKKYKASALILPVESSSMAGLTSLVENFSSTIPIGLGNIKNETQMDLYTTIIYSRTSIENLISSFMLDTLIKANTYEDLHKAVRKMITTKITIENAYLISVTTNTPQAAAEMTNFLLNYLNTKIIDLNISKAKENREFLESRYREVSDTLKKSEDSLKGYQEFSGVFDIENQSKLIFETLSRLEAELATKEVDYNVFKKIYGPNSPQTTTALLTINEMKNKIKAIESGKLTSGSVIGLSSLPTKALDFYRHLRDVKLSEEKLKYIIPAFEQSRFEEHKRVPIFQIIDYAVPPQKKSFPPRVLLSGIISLLSIFVFYSVLIVDKFVKDNTNTDSLILLKELFSFK